MREDLNLKTLQMQTLNLESQKTNHELAQLKKELEWKDVEIQKNYEGKRRVDHLIGLLALKDTELKSFEETKKTGADAKVLINEI